MNWKWRHWKISQDTRLRSNGDISRKWTFDAYFPFRVLSRYQTDARIDKSIGLLLPVPSDSTSIGKLRNWWRTVARTDRRTRANRCGAAVLDKITINLRLHESDFLPFSLYFLPSFLPSSLSSFLPRFLPRFLLCILSFSLWFFLSSLFLSFLLLLFLLLLLLFHALVWIIKYFLVQARS